MGSDVAAKLAEGVAAVDNTQTYVQACALRGYHHPDLTRHAAQVAEWFGTEEGLDLRALDADSAVLRSMAQCAAEGLDAARAQIGAIDAAWDGEGGRAAADFLRRHAASAAVVAATAEAAAAAADRLRDELWRIVSDKVDTTVSIDDRTSAQRAGWLSAARAVMAGGEVADDANRVVDTEITPYVTTTIAGEWVPAMRASLDAVVSAFRDAVDAVEARPRARFDIPGDLGPRAAPVSAPVAPPSAASVSPAVATVPAAAIPAIPAPPGEPVAATPAGLPTPPVVSNPAVPLSDPLTAAMPAAGMPAGLPDPFGGASGLPGRLADTLGGLFDAGPALGAPPADPALPESPEIPEFESGALDEEPLEEDAIEDVDDDEEEVDEAVTDEEPVVAETEPDAEADPETTAVDAAAEEATAPPADCPEPQDTEPPAPAPPVPPAADPAATPCEIAADELPQVGE